MKDMDNLTVISVCLLSLLLQLLLPIVLYSHIQFTSLSDLGTIASYASQCYSPRSEDSAASEGLPVPFFRILDSKAKLTISFLSLYDNSPIELFLQAAKISFLPY